MLHSYAILLSVCRRLCFSDEIVNTSDTFIQINTGRFRI
ncbi:hypothetical protein QSI_3204 [Clostridioides difficile P28]|nr:hypothetical protein QSI_3204 [Clostridioides difficile P28]